MKIKTADLIGPALDWAVAKCLPNPQDVTCKNGVVRRQPVRYAFTPSTNWAQGGPIIEQECMDILCLAGGDDGWQADKYLHTEQVIGFGHTPLVAAMRCFVASHLGDEVEIPDELV